MLPKQQVETLWEMPETSVLNEIKSNSIPIPFFIFKETTKTLFCQRKHIDTPKTLHKHGLNIPIVNQC